ncbi:hypothetical protein BGZ83_004078, partial [Gryganskiella cystojenkinii]
YQARPSFERNLHHARRLVIHRFVPEEYQWILDDAFNVQQLDLSIYAEPIIYDEELLQDRLQMFLETPVPPVSAQCMHGFLYRNAVSLTRVSLDRLEKHEYRWLSSLVEPDMFPVLRDFKLSLSVLDAVATDILFKICSRLERLSLDKVQLSRPTPSGTVPWDKYSGFLRLRSLHVSTPSDHRNAISWDELANCFFTLAPRLTSLEWGFRIGYATAINDSVRVAGASFIRQIENHAWPDLQSLHIDGAYIRTILDDQLAQVLAHCPSLTQLRLPCSRFGERSFVSLRRHFATLEILGLEGCKELR